MAQDLFNSLNAALVHKQNVSNVEQYYYYETVRVKHARRALGIKVNPYYTEHQERRFNQALYDQSLANANASIYQIGNQIECFLNDTSNFIQGKISEKNQLFARYQNAMATNAQLNTTIAQETTKLQQLNHDNKQILTILDKSSHSRNNIALQTDEISNIFKSANLSERSFLLSKLWSNKDNIENKNAISLIKSLAFDPSMLAYYAILESNQELFDLAIENKANFSNYLIEGVTLLQTIIRNGNVNFLQKVMALSNIDITATVLNSIDNDVKTIIELVKHKSDILTKEMYCGYTLLQFAIACDNKELVKNLLDIDNAIVTILSNKGESAFKIAIRSGNDEIIDILKHHVDIKSEIKQLNSLASEDIKESIIDQNDLDSLISLFKGDKNALLLSNINEEQDNSEESDLLEFLPKFDELLNSSKAVTISK